MSHPFHPDLAPLARWLPRGLGRRWSLPLLRPVVRSTSALQARRREHVALDGGGAVYIHRPRDAPDEPLPGLLWIHGGGLIMGDARQDEPFLQRLADELGLLVVTAQYRVAPEHPFPAPLDDCEQAFQWLATQSDVDPQRLAVAGRSAGGGLAAALCQRLRDAVADLQPTFQLLVYPMLDDRSAQGSGPDDAYHRLWDRASNALGWSSYLTGHDPEAPPPHAVPARAPDLKGLPPAWIGIGTLDLFHDEDVAYAERLRAAGVPVDLKVVEGAYHGFDVADARAAVSRAFREAQVAALAAWRTPDDTYLGAHAPWMALDGAPAPPDAIGLFLRGPRTLSYAATCSAEGLHARPLPQFVVAGTYLFDKAQLQALHTDPHEAIDLVVERDGERIQHPLDWWVDTYEYEAVGIDRSPAPKPPWDPPGEDGVDAMGGCFTIPLGLHTPEPTDGPYTLAVTAVCGQLRSATLHITVGP